MISAIRNSTHLGVTVRVPSGAAGAKPINLALLVDTSGSMEGERIDAVKKTLHAARDLFIPADKMTMVTFNDTATVVADHVRMDEAGIQQFYTAVDAVHAHGSTNLSAGIEKLLVLGGGSYDAILILTDGHINAGIVTNIGLRTMVLGLGSIPITALGYGPDHNRVLLRDLALRSRGSYIYVDSESVLPVAMGDLIGGLRSEVFKEAVLRVPSGWICCEIDGGDASYRLGSIVADRDYWVVFEKKGLDIDGPITLTAAEASKVAETDRIIVSDCHDLQEQVLRCQVAKVIVEASNNLEQSRPVGPEATALIAKIKALSEEMLRRPLVLRMQAQLAEIIATQATNILPAPSVLARMSSGGAYLSTQRGVSGDPTHTFASPLQRLASIQVQSQYAA